MSLSQDTSNHRGPQDFPSTPSLDWDEIEAQIQPKDPERFERDQEMLELLDRLKEVQDLRSALDSAWMAEMEQKPIEWLWAPRVPLGTITLLDERERFAVVVVRHLEPRPEGSRPFTGGWEASTCRGSPAASCLWPSTPKNGDGASWCENQGQLWSYGPGPGVSYRPTCRGLWLGGEERHPTQTAKQTGERRLEVRES